jgi:hypothetical protein
LKSHPTANRPYGDVPVRLVKTSFKSLYHQFKLLNGGIKCSYSSFLKHRPNYIKIGSTKTDMCSLCEKGKFLSSKLKKVQYNNNNERNKIIESIQLIKKHQNINEYQANKI